MGKNKSKRFIENETFSNIIQPRWEEGFPLKGFWWSRFFQNGNPIVLELGCGKGEYTLALAETYPQKNFIGVDIKGARFWQGAKNALKKGLKNVAFIRTRIEWIQNFFGLEEVNEIWITFPDPQIKHKRAKHRLTHPDFLKKYHAITKPGACIHLKTDSEFLYGYTQAILQCGGHEILLCSHDVYRPDVVHLPSSVTTIQTFYEKTFLREGKPISYIQFQLNFSQKHPILEISSFGKLSHLKLS
ncbi:MAG: tRNA (guanosine(46)-N7)-methyltransferase TrmB [Flavobacteriales bacterium AspAUS03]